MNKSEYIKKLMYAKPIILNGMSLLDVCLVYWHSDIPIDSASEYLNNLITKLTTPRKL